MNSLVLFTIFFPILLGSILFLLPEKKLSIGFLTMYTVLGLGVTFAAAIAAALGDNREICKLFSLMRGTDIAFRADGLGKVFSVLALSIWIHSGIFSFDYMRHEKKLRRYFGFYLITAGILMGLVFAANLVTMYLFFELMTLLSMPLVIQEESHEAVMAALKYLLYSFFGAYGALFGIFYLNQCCASLDFLPGGVLLTQPITDQKDFLLIVVFVMILGFGVKAGSFPMHAWLPTAHPVAPSPASAVLSGIIVKAGVFAIIRVVFYIVGPELIAGTWVQYTWMTLSLITVFLGSMLAYREKGLKKRLAYSTVSQLSYILFGLSLLTVQTAVGGLLHVVYHAVIKTALFLCAGAFIKATGKKNAADLRGIGKVMPVTLGSFTLVSLGLIGIPPFSGFISKWHLALGALNAEVGVFSWLGPVILLASALLTAGYLMPIVIDGFLPGEDYKAGKQERKENVWICVPVALLAAGTFVLGVYPNGLIHILQSIVEAWF